MPMIYTKREEAMLERARTQADILYGYKKTIREQQSKIDWLTDRVATATFWMKLKYLFGGKL